MTTAFVLGNGQSRQGLDLALLATKAPIYGCNALYRDFTPTVLVSTDRPISSAIQESGYAAQHRFHTRKPAVGSGARPVPQQYFGFSSGPLATAIAALDGHDVIYLIGFDMGPAPGDRFNNIYADTEFYKKSSAKPTYTGNWIRQICHIARDFGRIRFIRVMGPTTAKIKEFADIQNIFSLGLDEFQRLVVGLEQI